MTTATSEHVALPDGTTVEVRITGDGPVPVVAIAGGAAPSIDFFPGIRRLQGVTVIEHDRVGTGRTPERPSGPTTLASAAADLHALRLALDLPPVVVLAQSFGGAVWAQWLVDFSEDIAGAVIIDPTPVNDPVTVKKTAPALGMIDFLVTTPLIRTPYNALATRMVSKGLDIRDPEIDAALTAILDKSQWARMVRQFATLPEQCAALTERLSPHPGHAVVIGADRKDRGSQKGVRLAQEDLCRRLGARYEVWPGAVHTEHLRQPRQVMEAVQSVVNLQLRAGDR